jgi:hypothetical protein
VLAATACLLGLWALALAGSAAALPSNCTQLGATVTCTFSPGSEGTFAVPANVSGVHVVANGGAGAGNGLNRFGGPGAQVTSDLNVMSGSNLFVEVGIGGGPGPFGVGTGGGESDVRTCSISVSTCVATGTANDPRLVVAGGGGGAGTSGLAGTGGAGGTGLNMTCNPGMNGNASPAANGGGGGFGGGCASGGAGGPAGPDGQSGFDGSASSGGAGGVVPFFTAGGGGGGAGFFGGGGGGSSGTSNHGFVNGGGGGGGSSFGPTGSVFAAATTGPSVTISYTLTLSDLAGTLVSDADSLAPGTALASQARAIEAAVSAGKTHAGCGDITVFLNLVSAQTNKKLTQAHANQLTTDATNLAVALGC